jgi:L-cystine transport system permease protein
MDVASIPGYCLKLMTAFPVTIRITLESLLFSLIIGVVVTVMSLSKKKAVSTFAKGYIAFMRGIPTLILIFLLYLGLPQLMNRIGVNMQGVNTITYIIATLSLSSSANMSEMMRTSYLAINKGQLEAAYSVGMTWRTAFRRIIFPQALGIAIPTFGNNIILMFKETSLAFTVGVLDLLGKGRAISSASYGTNRLEVYVACGIIFWICVFLLEKGTQIAERVYTKGRRKNTAG